MLEGMIQSMWNLAPPKDDAERRLYENIETALREFQQNVDLRLSEEVLPEGATIKDLTNYGSD